MACVDKTQEQDNSVVDIAQCSEQNGEDSETSVDEDSSCKGDDCSCAVEDSEDDWEDSEDEWEDSDEADESAKPRQSFHEKCQPHIPSQVSMLTVELNRHPNVKTSIHDEQQVRYNMSLQGAQDDLLQSLKNDKISGSVTVNATRKFFESRKKELPRVEDWSVETPWYSW